METARLTIPPGDAGGVMVYGRMLAVEEKPRKGDPGSPWPSPSARGGLFESASVRVNPSSDITVFTWLAQSWPRS
jgi:hypothetical protein